MRAILHLLEHLPAIVIALGFILVAAPAGLAAISGFLGIMAAFGQGKEADKHREVKVGRVFFKGPVRLGLVALAIIFALIALRESEHKSTTSKIPDFYSSDDNYRDSNSSDRRITESSVFDEYNNHDELSRQRAVNRLRDRLDRLVNN